MLSEDFEEKYNKLPENSKGKILIDQVLINLSNFIKTIKENKNV